MRPAPVTGQTSKRNGIASHYEDKIQYAASHTDIQESVGYPESTT